MTMNCTKRSNERRNFPKVNVGGEANILLAGVVRNGKLMNLSRVGLQIECRHQLVEQLTKSKSEAGLFPEFELEFALPNSDKSRFIKSTCNVSYCRRQRQDSYHLGLSFVDLDEKDERKLEDYLSHPVAA